MLFLRRAHSPFIKNLKKKQNNNTDVNIKLGKTNRLKALCMMQIKKMKKTKTKHENKKHLHKSMTKKEEALFKQTALVKAANSIK